MSKLLFLDSQILLQGDKLIHYDDYAGARMTLYLVRHGEARTEIEDPQRPLNDRGQRAVEQVASWVARAGLRVSEIRHSGRKRAEETAAIFSKHLSPSKDLMAVSGLGPNDDVAAVAEDLKYETEPLMLVGHLPFLSRLSSLLIANDPSRMVVQFRMAGIVCLQKDENQWAIAWAVTPDLLP